MEAKINKSVYVTAAVYIVLGLVMVIYPETTMKTFCLALGTIFAVLGIINLVIYFTRDVMESVYRYDFVSGVMLILAGLMFIVKMDKIIELIPVILGVLVLFDGVIKLQHAIDLKRIDVGGWIYVFVFSLLCLSVGTVCILQPEFIASTIVIIMGISYLFCGITDFITIFLLRNRIKDHAAGSDSKKDKAETADVDNAKTGSSEAVSVEINSEDGKAADGDVMIGKADSGKEEKPGWMFWKKDKKSEADVKDAEESKEEVLTEAYGSAENYSEISEEKETDMPEEKAADIPEVNAEEVSEGISEEEAAVDDPGTDLADNIGDNSEETV